MNAASGASALTAIGASEPQVPATIIRMGVSLRGRLALSGLVIVLAGAGFGCDWLPTKNDPGWPSWPGSPSNPRDDAASGETPDAAPASGADAGGGSYDAMCMSYCKALEETDVLTCASSGRDVSACVAASASVPADCFDLRCRTHRADLSICLAQCDSLASAYGKRCPVAGDPSVPLCSSSPADHDAACRAGCR